MPDDPIPSDAFNAYLAEQARADPEITRRLERADAMSRQMREYRESKWLGPLLFVVAVAIVAAGTWGGSDTREGCGSARHQP